MKLYQIKGECSKKRPGRYCEQSTSDVILQNIFNMVKSVGHQCQCREYAQSCSNHCPLPFGTVPLTKDSYGYVDVEVQGAEHPLAMNGVVCSCGFLNFGGR